MDAILETVPVMPLDVMGGLLRLVQDTDHSEVGTSLVEVVFALAARTRGLILTGEHGVFEGSGGESKSPRPTDLYADCVALHGTALSTLWSWGADGSGRLDFFEYIRILILHALTRRLRVVSRC